MHSLTWSLLTLAACGVGSARDLPPAQHIYVNNSTLGATPVERDLFPRQSCAPGPSCSDGGYCCSGQECCGASQCAPSDGVCCPNGGHCPAGDTCTQEGNCYFDWCCAGPNDFASSAYAYPSITVPNFSTFSALPTNGLSSNQGGEPSHFAGSSAIATGNAGGYLNWYSTTFTYYYLVWYYTSLQTVTTVTSSTTTDVTVISVYAADSQSALPQLKSSANFVASQARQSASYSKPAMQTKAAPSTSAGGAARTIGNTFGWSDFGSIWIPVLGALSGALAILL